MKEGYGEFIKAHRLKNGYSSQRHLAKESGISAATISRIESEIQKPELETLFTLSQYLKTTSYEELMIVCNYDVPNKNDKNNYIYELTDLNIIRNIRLTVDGLELSKEEMAGIVSYIRTYRTMVNN